MTRSPRTCEEVVAVLFTEADPASAAPLSALLDALGSLVEVVTAPRGLAVAIGDILIFDGLGGPPVAADDLLLAVGVDLQREAAVDVVRRAGEAGAAAVVFKRSGVPSPTVLHTADERGVAILAVPAATAWGQLLSLLRTARVAGTEGSSGAADELRVGDLFGLANAIAATVGGATTIEDLQLNVLAYSSLGHPIDQPRRETILGRRVPVSWSRALADQGFLRRIYGGPDVIRIPHLARRPGGPAEPDEIDARPRLAVAMRVGSEPIGSIWVVEGSEPFTAEAAKSLRAAAQIGAMHLLHHRSAADIERRRSSEQLRALLERGRLVAGGTRLRLPRGVPLTVFAFAAEFADSDIVDVAVQSLETLISLHVDVFRRNAYVVSIGESVYLLLSSWDARDRAKMLALAEDLRGHVERAAKRRVVVGVGASVLEPEDVHRSRSEAEQVARLVGSRAQSVGHVDDLRGAIALRQVEEWMAGDPLLRAGKVDLLAANDAEKGTSYIETLKAYLDNFGDVVAGSDALFIHRNTFRYRLARLLEISGLNLGDPEERLITHLQLRLHTRRRDGC